LTFERFELKIQTMASAPTDGRPDEFAVRLAGIGGQGIQLIGKTLALAATRAGRHVMLAADYGGEMRGGPSNASVVVGPPVAEAPRLRSLPVLPAFHAAIVANHRFTGVVPERLVPGAVLLLNSSVVDPAGAGEGYQVTAVPATRLAAELGVPQAGGFVLLGAFVALVPLVSEESLVEAMTSLLPAYRRQHAEGNARALRAGIETVAGVAA
jgi:2-oxoglutarate ferredoxin oxidoreductase subunit gamma